MNCSNDKAFLVVRNIVQTIQQNKDFLSQIDGQIGDGDHGVNMNKGFTTACELFSQKEMNMSSAFSILANVLMTQIGGSIGPLFGTLFNEMANASKDDDFIEVSTVEKMLHTALISLNEITPARQGDKTLMDVLIPASEAVSTAVNEGNNLEEALKKMKIAAEKGKESTKEYIAKFGRSSRLGERSKGYYDAGAVSLNLILQSFADTLIELAKESE